MNDPFASAPQRQDTGQDNSSDPPIDMDIVDAAVESDAVDQFDTPPADTPPTDSAVTAVPGPDEVAPSADASIDLDAIERDLTDVQTALERLNDGSYWTDEVTGNTLPDEVLASFPLTRTVAGRSTT